MIMKIVLAYSGGLDTSVAIKWLNEKYNAEIITLTLDIGQKEDFKNIEERAYKIGAIKHYTIDAKEEFVRDYIFPAIKANAMYEEKYPLSTALGRPLIAKKLVEIAHKEGAEAVAHGCTGKGNDQLRIEITVRALDPSLKIFAPTRDWGMSRDQELKYAEKHNIPISRISKKYSVDQNLWGRSIEGGPLEDPWNIPEEDVWEWTVSPEKAPNEPKIIEIEFKDGIPIKVDGKLMDSLSLINYLNEIAGSHGVGRIDHIEDRIVGIKSRETYECPAAITIIEAHKDLEKLVLNRRELNFKRIVDNEWAFLVYAGLWEDPLRYDLDAFINKVNERVEGTVRIKLYKGSIMVVGRQSPYSIYDIKTATYESISTFDQTLSKGFVSLWGLQTVFSRNKMKRCED
ncbi:MAG: argininosuccinate synthase [Candidatus Methanomethylicota archaeon]|uniref:Argininosuccinate synthase n=1 Tax=Thermoproteota archaeon TaxID=2056631 RepID=A0A520KGU4_9CREN|nr:argininosuccinate synthase [Candidatus Verstraetearchaeota archaeon]RZN57472.1 MAG: argininosuccinate synthase [Candidatus Verstraetearchaeota archaeon]TDA38637.1 MAG: argininosuccinate synthase [Candidatus Verstraetearchaeota archaeon]